MDVFSRHFLQQREAQVEVLRFVGFEAGLLGDVIIPFQKLAVIEIDRLPILANVLQVRFQPFIEDVDLHVQWKAADDIDGIEIYQEIGDLVLDQI